VVALSLTGKMRQPQTGLIVEPQMEPQCYIVSPPSTTDTRNKRILGIHNFGNFGRKIIIC